MAITIQQAPLDRKISTKNAQVGIIGLGYVGLPTACHKANEGFDVTGFDVSEEKVSLVQSGTSYIKDVDSAHLSELVDQGKLTATTDLTKLKDMDVILICVPTPINEYKEPNLAFVDSASEAIVSYATENTLVILESTTYPGTTEEYLVAKLEQRGYQIGEDFYVAYSPERVDPGNQKFSLENTPKVVGGYTERCTELAAMFVGSTAYPVSNLKVAEMSKAFENSFRYINMGFVNEMAVICNEMGIDIWEVIEASSSKPYGFMKFTPGVGVGGHCIPVDPYYITHKAKEFGKKTKMIELAGELNDEMTHYTYHRMMELLNEQGKALSQSTVAVLGVTYKENISDVRESPVLPLLDKLQSRVKKLVVVDPYVKTFSYKEMGYVTQEYGTLSSEDIDFVLLTTPHDDFPYETLAEDFELILDAKNAFAQKGISKPSIKTL